ncbi:sensor histidine kinase [Kitasatospora sp. NPDC051170]|uniref:sensor histidine kinase n=1 Tax=Kitasatospora sp. NPDC051170 TaxID=3364056 RepID=UPI0037B2D6C3
MTLPRTRDYRQDVHLRPPLTRRLTRDQLVGLDVAVGVALLLWGRPTDAQLATAGLSLPGWYALLTPLAGAVAARRLWPGLALGVSLAAYATMAAYGFAKGPSLAVAFCLYQFALSQPRSRAVAGLVLAEAVVGVGMAMGGSSVLFDNAWAAMWLGQSAPLVAIWAAGTMIRSQRAYNAGLRAQAERQAQARIEEARRTVVEERLRIARELHDVMAHSMSVIAVQAGVGRHVITGHPDEAAKALTAIETVSRTALREVRALLDVLREESPADDPATTSEPAQPGLSDLPVLIEQTGRTGLQVELRIRGAARQLPPSIDLACYRIVQEALTNSVKHAATARARARVSYHPDGIEIEVTDEGRPGPAVAPDSPGGHVGHGLIGMRERVALSGGDFAAGHLPLGGFRVWARFPTGEPG